MLRKVVGEIFFTFAPVDLELLLGNSILYPVETHVDSLGSALLDGIVGNACCCGVIDDDRGRWLRVAHFFEGCAERDGVAHVEV